MRRKQEWEIISCDRNGKIMSRIRVELDPRPEVPLKLLSTEIMIADSELNEKRSICAAMLERALKDEEENAPGT